MTKLLIIVAILAVVCITSGVASPQSRLGPNSIEQIPVDTAVNGYLLTGVDALPYSPVVEPLFNLPETSLVELYFTDTLQTDTVWILNKQILPEGFYRIRYTPFNTYVSSTGIRAILLHVTARSQSSASGPGMKTVESRYEAACLMYIR
ncbi:MAG: hypothetical protein RBT76_15055 [candidate division Zixibacteria bacterium]|jgi:hypothetical protein|nr:hypothetical protein [candidate division Zixibacteria bacterium]